MGRQKAATSASINQVVEANPCLDGGAHARSLPQQSCSASLVNAKIVQGGGEAHSLGNSLPASWPGLSRPPRLFLLCDLKIEVAGTSPATTLACDFDDTHTCLQNDL